MRNFKIILVVALGAVLFTSCSRGYGCYYGNVETQGINPETNQTMILDEPAPQDTYTTAIAR